MFQHAEALAVPPWLTDPRDQIDRVLRQTDPEDPDAAHWVRALERVGFAMLDIDDRTETWREIMTAKHENRLEHAPLVSSLLGERRARRELATSRAMLGIGGPSQIQTTRRVELVAYKARLARSGSCV